MSRYYGTAVPTLPGYDRASGQRPVWAPELVDEIWCEEAGCPARECVACQAKEAHDG